MTLCSVCCESDGCCEVCHRAARAAAKVDVTLWDRLRGWIWRHA